MEARWPRPLPPPAAVGGLCLCLVVAALRWWWTPPLHQQLDVATAALPAAALPHNFSFWAPTALQHDRVHLFGFADRVADRESELCISIESALLNGWKYQLIGPTVPLRRTFMLRGQSQQQRFDEKALKIFTLSLLMDALPPDAIVVFVDAMDVLFQRNASEFAAAVAASRLIADGAVLYGAEKNCWPFSRTNKKTYHCPLMQGEHWKPTGKEPGLGCKLQDKVYNDGRLAPLIPAHTNTNTTISNGSSTGGLPVPFREERSIYLNSGLSVGRVGNYSRLVRRSNDMLGTLPHLCVDDQGLLAWQMVTDAAAAAAAAATKSGGDGPRAHPPSIVLDYASEWLGNLNDRKMRFDWTDGLMKLWRYEQGSAGAVTDRDSVVGNATTAPFMIHFNGNGKAGNSYNLTRDLILAWKQKHGFNVRAFLENDAVLWVDGVERKFSDVCRNHVAARVASLE